MLFFRLYYTDMKGKRWYRDSAPINCIDGALIWYRSFYRMCKTDNLGCTDFKMFKLINGKEANVVAMNEA